MRYVVLIAYRPGEWEQATPEEREAYFDAHHAFERYVDEHGRRLSSGALCDADTATTTGHAPAARATEKTASLPTNPEVSGMPAMARRKNANTAATTGDSLPRPAQRSIAVVSPPLSRTRPTTAKAPIVAKP